MATITKRDKRWAVQIRRKGFEPEFRSFRSKKEAQEWAREREAKIDVGQQPIGLRIAKETTLGDIIRRYIAEITPTKASAESERLRLLKMLTAPMTDLALSELTSAAISAYRDHRTLKVKPATIARELSLLHNIIEVARRDWSICLEVNVIDQVRRVPVRNARDRM